jgi:hypothetical protein
MSLSFSRSTRALVSDTFRPSLVGMLLGVLVLGLWGAWFALARTPLYETTATAQLNREGDVIARFEPGPFARVRPGQPATVIDTVTGQSRRAEVMEVANRVQNRMEASTVRLYVYGAPPLQESPREVQVQVGEESPLLALLRLGANAPPQRTTTLNQ